MATNDVTGDRLVTKPSTDAYAEGWDRIFGKKNLAPIEKPPEKKKDERTPEQIERDRLTAEWWAYCEKNQVGDHVLTYQEWYDKTYGCNAPMVDCGECRTQGCRPKCRNAGR